MKAVIPAMLQAILLIDRHHTQRTLKVMEDISVISSLNCGSVKIPKYLTCVEIISVNSRA